MNIEGVEKTEGKVCTKCGVWKPLEEYHKNKNTKDGRVSYCKQCRNKPPKETREGMKKCTKCGEWKALEEYHKTKNNKDGYQTQCKKCTKEYGINYFKSNKDKINERNKNYYKNNKERLGVVYKNYRNNNKERIHEYQKEHYKNNKDKKREYGIIYRENNKHKISKRHKEHYEKRKQLYLNEIRKLVNAINTNIINELNIPVYGIIYKIENTKTKHVYIGKTIRNIKIRYGKCFISEWIKERMGHERQKFKDELADESVFVFNVIDVGMCSFHLNRLESWYIDKYDSYNNGYNNKNGNYKSDDGIEEFNQILSDHNLEFKDGKLIQIKSTHQDR